jgi:hypothetical protein
MSFGLVARKLRTGAGGLTIYNIQKVAHEGLLIRQLGQEMLYMESWLSTFRAKIES